MIAFSTNLFDLILNGEEDCLNPFSLLLRLERLPFRELLNAVGSWDFAYSMVVIQTVASFCSYSHTNSRTIIV